MAKNEARKPSTAQEIMIRNTEYPPRIISPAGGKEALRCHTCARIVTGSRWKTTFGGSLGEKDFTIGGARSVEKTMIGSYQNRLLVVQTGESVNQAKVFRAHAVPQGLCGNMINALTLLANQQEDGDGVIQNIVTNLGEGSRKGLTNGLRDFIEIESSESDRVFNYSHDSNSIFRAAGINSEIFSARTVNPLRASANEESGPCTLPISA